MIYPILILIALIALTDAHKKDCHVKINAKPNMTYSFNKFYNASDICRFTAICPEGYNCHLKCRLSIQSSEGCNSDRLLVSLSGDPTLSGAKPYCGLQILNLVSTSKTISMGLIATTSSTGGYVLCRISARPAREAATQQCRCGERKLTRIVGGNETKITEYPMMAGLLYNSEDTIYCGGVIISSRYVLTAAHCVYKMNVKLFSLVYGIHAIEDFVKRRKIQRFIVHENYKRDNFDYDVALVMPKQKIILSQTVQPACLPFKYQGTSLKDKTVTILGWGLTSPGGMRPNTLHKVEVDIIDQERCRASEGNITDRQICTYTPGKDACQYDSGGPLLLADPSGILYVAGLVSYSNKWCGTSSPAINTRLDTLLQWITNNTKENYCNR